MSAISLPFQPIRSQLYKPAELFFGFDAVFPESWARTLDFEVFRHFVVEGRNAPANPYSGMMQALHDSSITQATEVLTTGRKVAAIMGGHKMLRDSGPYKSVVEMSRRMTRNGLLICTGGGPGAMEASHLGAALANYTDGDLANALAELTQQAAVPPLANIVASDGKVDLALAAQAHAWFSPAYALAQALTNAAESLAVPTWHYGHEPTTPFATHIAKYFQNSVREDGLLALARQGVVYSEGKAGTIQEIFQDAAQNYYKTFKHFSPMVLFGVNYWTNSFPVVAVLEKLFAPADFAKYVLVTDDVVAAAGFLEAFVP
jgi:predicted Rossmann-fold nucleotide-binding protein